MTQSDSPAVDPSRPVLVGTDGSPDSGAAIAWAAQAAAIRGVPLQVLHCLDHETILTSRISRRELDEYAEALAARSAQEARAAQPEIEVSSEVRVGPPAQVLVDAADRAQLLVLGRRGGGGFRRMLMGSTSTAAAYRTRTPLVVVPGDWKPADQPRPIVVGVDSSPENVRAVQAAFEAAESAGSTLHAVRGWEMSPIFAGDMADVVGGFDRYEEEARQQLADSLRPWQARFPDVTVEQEVVRGHAVDVVVEASEGAGLVVIGAHGHKRLRGTSLGSVTRGVLHHAKAPVAVVPSG